MQIREDQWLSSIFGYRVFGIKFDCPAELQGHAISCIGEQVSDHASRQSGAMYYARLDTRNVEAVLRLGSVGFGVVEASVQFAIDARTNMHLAEATEPLICDINREQHQKVLDIASSCFQYSRFHLDPLVPDQIANQIKHDWVLSYLRRERGERLLVALSGGKAVGFLAVLSSELNQKRVKTIDLMGVDKAFQNQGVGKALVNHFIRQFKGQCDVLSVGTQAANIPSIRLYQSQGFSIVKMQYAMHMHIRDGSIKHGQEE